MPSAPSAGNVQQETTEKRPKRKQGKPNRLEDHLVQIKQYTWYRQLKKTRTREPNDTSKDIDFVLEETENMEDSENNDEKNNLEYQKVVEEFLKNLKIDPTTADSVKSKYNKLTSAEQEN